MQTILVCEDDTNNRRGFCEMLTLLGYRVLQAATGKKAIEIFKTQNRPVDLLISDVDLPDVSGTDVALALSESSPRMPILFVSGNPIAIWSRRDLCNFKRLPSALVDFIEKPFRLLTLQNKISDLLNHASAI